MSTNAPASWWSRLNGNDVECVLCPRQCRIKDGHRGFCFGRQNAGGKLVVTTYGRTSGIGVDPIEKKPLYHFYPGSTTLSFGTIGCNLGCVFCQNWDISRAKTLSRLTQEAEPRAIVEYAKRLGAKSVAFTYNEPIVFAEYAMDVARECRRLGLKAIAVSNGYINPQPAREFFALMDAANIDLKAFTNIFYEKLCAAKLQPVLDTIKFIKKETSVWLEITNLLVPDENDAKEETERLCGWIAAELGRDVPLHFSAFHPDHRLTDKEATPSKTLTTARAIAWDRGLHYVYTGNVFDPEGSSTFCPQCGKVLIERRYYQIAGYHLKETDRCGSCGHVCAGHFDRKEQGG